jgi:cell division protein FtsI (penicillin-binding protein 3)
LMPGGHRTPPLRVTRPAGRTAALRGRAFKLLLIGVLAFAVIVGRLVDLQVFAAGRYQRYSREQDVEATALPALRGAILDRDGRTLAMSETRSTIIADPHQISDPAGEAATLAPILRMSPATLVSDLEEDSGFVYVAHDVSAAVASSIEKLGLAGITSEDTQERFHPAGQLAAPLLGSVDDAGVGASGLEYAYNSELTGTPGQLVQEVDPEGQAVAGGTISRKQPVLGDDLLLTIDEPLQYQAEQALGQALVAAHGRSGIAMVMNTHTGGLLAVADLSEAGGGSSTAPALPVAIGSQGQLLTPGTPPTLPQPTESSSADAFTQVYEPGSLEKLITVSAALNSGAITPSETFSIPNAYPVDGIPIHDAENHGAEMLSVTGIVAQSSNIGATEIAQRVGAAGLYSYLSAYGLGAITPVRFPGESAGLVTPLSQVSPLTLATTSYGEGIGVTAAQMITAYNTIADGGVYVAPHLVKALIGGHGREHILAQPKPHRVVSTEVADEMTTIFEQVVSAGTGTAAMVAPYAVGGKTGTAQYDGPDGYVAGYTDASFAGFAPAQNPAVTVMVVIDDTPDYGAQAAAPAFATITRDALTDLQIPPAGPQPPAERTALPQPVTPAAGTGVLGPEG